MQKPGKDSPAKKVTFLDFFQIQSWENYISKKKDTLLTTALSVYLII